MIYYTIYLKNLNNGTGYIDIPLENDQLVKDYLQFLDLGIRAYKPYPVADAGKSRGGPGSIVINLSDIAAIVSVAPQ
jgi:hypothetical protein